MPYAFDGVLTSRRAATDRHRALAGSRGYDRCRPTPEPAEGAAGPCLGGQGALDGGARHVATTPRQRGEMWVWRARPAYSLPTQLTGSRGPHMPPSPSLDVRWRLLSAVALERYRDGVASVLVDDIDDIAREVNDGGANSSSDRRQRRTAGASSPHTPTARTSNCCRSSPETTAGTFRRQPREWRCLATPRNGRRAAVVRTGFGPVQVGSDSSRERRRVATCAWFPSRGLTLGELAVVERVVEAVVVEQLGVAAVLHDVPVVHDDDRVGVADRGQAVRDDEARAAVA